MTIYHVKTQQAYDELMNELEEKGYKWRSGYKPTEYNYWEQEKKTLALKFQVNQLLLGTSSSVKNNAPTPLSSSIKQKETTWK